MQFEVIAFIKKMINSHRNSDWDGTVNPGDVARHYVEAEKIPFPVDEPDFIKKTIEKECRPQKQTSAVLTEEELKEQKILELVSILRYRSASK